MIVYCLGPAGTSSYDAALELFPKESLHLFKNFDALFNALTKNSATGFVPIENSLHGSIDEVLDLLIEFEMKIWKTFDVSITLWVLWIRKKYRKSPAIPRHWLIAGSF